MKKLLILSPFLPWPLNSGGNTGVFNMLKAVAQDLNVYFVTAVNSVNKVEYSKKLGEIIPNLHICLYDYKKSENKKYEYIRKVVRRLQQKMSFDGNINALSFSLNDEITPGYVDFVNKLIESKGIDIVQVEFCSYLPWVYVLPENVRKIFIHHELRYIRDAQEYKNNRYGSYLTNFAKDNEVAMLNKYDRIVSMTSIDKAKLKDVGVLPPIYVSTLAITDKTPIALSFSTSNNLSFVGGSVHIPNYEGIIWFAKEVLPLVIKEIPDASLDIIGSWSDDAKKDVLSLSSNIRFKGFVPQLIDGIKDTLMVVPINIGSGIRMKILEASSNSVPFVSTVVGVEGLDFENGKDCLIARTGAEMASQIVSVLKNPSLYSSLAKNAYNTFVEKYSFEAMKKMRLAIYE